jgi:hypothetical protein
MKTGNRLFLHTKRLVEVRIADSSFSDTAAINAAIAYQGNCGFGCESSSVKGTLIYFPAGTYLISTPINAYYYTQLVGDVRYLICCLLLVLNLFIAK